LWAVFACPIGVAHASDDTMRGTLNHYAPKIVRDEHAVNKGGKEYSLGQIGALPRALKHEVRDLRALKATLAGESPSSAAGALAKTKMVTGLGLIARAYSAFRRDLLAANGGLVPDSKFNAAVRTDTKGRRQFLAGLKLLR
jgi:hypothetical protein